VQKRAGILVVDRVGCLRGRGPVGPPKRPPVLGKTNEEVLRGYRGFDGLVWPEMSNRGLRVAEGLAPVRDANEVRAYARSLPYASECDVVGLAFAAETRAFDSKEWHFIGIDVGYFESEWSLFSVILNEIIYGIHPALVDVASELNESFLLGSHRRAARLLELRAQVERSGADVERGGPPMTAIEIYGPREN
jgi:hypothetical protein